MADRDWPEHLEEILAPIQLHAEVNALHVVGDHLPLAGLPLTEKVGVYRTTNARTEQSLR